jgi:hypothetical protein
VFTLPRVLAPLALQNKRVIYGLLFRASAATFHNPSESSAIRKESSRHLG